MATAGKRAIRRIVAADLELLAQPVAGAIEALGVDVAVGSGLTHAFPSHHEAVRPVRGDGRPQLVARAVGIHREFLAQETGPGKTAAADAAAVAVETVGEPDNHRFAAAERRHRRAQRWIADVVRHLDRGAERLAAGAEITGVHIEEVGWRIAVDELGEHPGDHEAAVREGGDLGITSRSPKTSSRSLQRISAGPSAARVSIVRQRQAAAGEADGPRPGAGDGYGLLQGIPDLPDRWRLSSGP